MTNSASPDQEPAFIVVGQDSGARRIAVGGDRQTFEAVRLGGTVSAEHGLGKRKAHLLALQYGPAEIEAMKAVKRRLDPHWLLSPGNLLT